MNSTNNLAPTTALNCDQRDADDMARLAKGHDASLNELMERHAEKLFQYEEKSQAETAEILSCTVKAVENRISRAHKQLRAALADGRQRRRMNGVSCNPGKLGPSRRIPTPVAAKIDKVPVFP